KLDKILESYQPDIIHCFDTNAYNVIKLLVPASKNKFVLTKPGGPNKADFPVCENLTLFSEENRRWFAMRKRYNNTNIYLIPNRVKRIQITDSKIASTIQKDAAEFTFVRIARLGEAYKKGILDAINLIRILTD